MPGQNQLVSWSASSPYLFLFYGSTYNVPRKWRYHSANLSHKRCNTKTGVSIMKTIEHVTVIEQNQTLNNNTSKGNKKKYYI